MPATSPYDAITPERIKEEMLSNLTVQGEEIETREGSYANTLVSVMAYQLFKLYQSFPGLLAACFPDEASGEYLDRHAAEVGMQRRPGQKATVVITVTGTDGTQVPIGTTFYAPEQGLCYHSTAEGSIQGGTAAIPAQAAEIGSAYNLPAGAICAMYINVAGIVAVSNEEAAQGGADPESDGDLYARYHLRRTLPITSGNKAHYVTWALEVPGVAHASCIPLWAGNGTVKVIIGGPGRTAVDESIRSACAVHIEEERPIGAAVTVESIRLRTLPLSASVTLMEGATGEEVQGQLQANVTALLRRLPFGETVTIPYSRFLACLLQCEGVADYSAFTVDGAASAVTLEAADAPSVGTIEIQTT